MKACSLLKIDSSTFIFKRISYKVKFTLDISDNVVKFDMTKHLSIFTQKERKFHFSYHIWHFMCYVGLTSPQDHWLFNWTRCVVSLPFLFSDTIYSGNINSWRSYYENIFWLLSYVSCACELFSANLIVFAFNDLAINDFIKSFMQE